MGRDGNYRNMGILPFLSPDHCRGFQPVHDRHLNIHENQIIAGPILRRMRQTQEIQRIPAVIGDIHATSELDQHLGNHLLVQFVILHQQYG